ncbi:MAG: hypothetical protein OEZ34_17365 [Spirochaetia bacterium]|nr:hypothetical protein [Spirochaetia bacterium]
MQIKKTFRMILIGLLFFPVSLISENQKGSGSQNNLKRFSLGLSIVDSNPAINTRFYFMEDQSLEATVGAVEGGVFFNIAYLYDFVKTGEDNFFKFYGGSGFISTVVSVDTGFLGEKKTYSATGLWLPVGISINFLPVELFAELDVVVFVGSYSGSDLTYSLGGRFYF